uniref:Uncharacterized protein n=1 Tax=Rhizophora mucronata TaxID=61149 RepID=A0A2P2N1E4_RHIMU
MRILTLDTAVEIDSLKVCGVDYVSLGSFLFIWDRSDTSTPTRSKDDMYETSL